MDASNKQRSTWYAAVLLVIALLIWAAEKRRTVSVDSGSRTLMGTLSRIVVVAANKKQADDAIRAAFDQIVHIEKLMSDRDPNSQLSLVNRRAFFEPVQVDDSLFEVLTASMEYSRLSDGAFDITVGPVVQLWRTERKTGVAPSSEALQEAHRLVGWQNLVLEPETKTVRFKKEGMKLDLGAIAKGYANDKAVETLQRLGLAGGMVVIGGEIRCFGKPAHGARNWNIGIQDPRQEDNIIAVLNLNDKAVSTSGDYRRFAVVNGQRLSHIIDPNSAQSAQSVSSVTIIAPTGMQTDALSTAVTVMGDRKGLALIESLPDTEAILIKDGAMIKSRNADQYISEVTD